MVAIQDCIDTKSAMGKFQMAVFGALAEYEREIIRERTIAGLEAAKKRGRVGGRPKGIGKETLIKAQLVKKISEDKSLTIIEICKQINISKATYYRLLSIEKGK